MIEPRSVIHRLERAMTAVEGGAQNPAQYVAITADEETESTE
jgi:hypothetical protein